MNSTNLTGNLTRDPELRRTANGKAYTYFCVAVKRPYTKDKTDFIDCVIWNESAEFVHKYFSKGSGIAVSGFTTTRNWVDKNGVTHKTSEVVASTVDFTGRRNESNDTYAANDQNEASATAESAALAGDYEMLEDDDGQLPF